MQFEYFNIPAIDCGSENSRTIASHVLEATVLEAAIEQQESRIEQISNRLRKLEQDETTEIETLVMSIVDLEGESDQVCAIYADLNSLALEIRKRSAINPTEDDHHDLPASVEWSDSVKKTASRVIQALSKELEFYIEDLQSEMHAITLATHSKTVAKLEGKSALPHLQDFFGVEAQIEQALAIQAQLQCLGYFVWTSSTAIDYRAKIAELLVADVPNQNLANKEALDKEFTTTPICQRVSAAA